MALFIDVLDGQTTKTLGTLSLALGLLDLAAHRMTNRAVFNYLPIAGLLAFVLITVYRAAEYQGWL